jgi:hypothetical protein
VAGDHVVGLAEFHSWTAQIPEDLTDPEDLREALGMSSGLDNGMSPAEVLEMLGVELPLDDNERQIIARFNASSAPDGAVVAVSDDRGSTWTIEYLDESIAGIAISGDRYFALSATRGEPTRSTLLTSVSGTDLEQLTELPFNGVGRTLAATADAVFVADAQSGALWTLPIEGS